MKKILLYGLDKQRISTISGIATGMSDELHVVKNKELSEKVIDILEKEAHPHFTEEPARKLELCMFAGFDREGIFTFIEELRKTGIRRPVFATVTANNLEWNFEKVLVDVNQEHIEMQKMNSSETKND